MGPSNTQHLSTGCEMEGVLSTTSKDRPSFDDRTSNDKLSPPTPPKEQPVLHGGEWNEFTRLGCTDVSRRRESRINPTTSPETGDNDLILMYARDLDMYQSSAYSFSAVVAAFIVPIMGVFSPNSPGGMGPPYRGSRALTMSFASLSVTMFVALISTLGKQWLLRRTRIGRRDNDIGRGIEHQAGFEERLFWITESLRVLLQFAAFLFAIALVLFLWDLSRPAAVVWVVTCAFFALCVSAAVVSVVCSTAG